MTQLSQQNQIHYMPEVCTDKSEILISKKQKRSRFVTFTQVLVLFSLISFAHTSISATSDEDLLNWTDNVLKETLAALSKGQSLTLADIKQMVNDHFPLGPNSITTQQISDLKQYFANELKNAGVSASLVTQLANWFESALDRFRGD